MIKRISGLFYKPFMFVSWACSIVISKFELDVLKFSKHVLLLKIISFILKAVLNLINLYTP